MLIYLTGRSGRLHGLNPITKVILALAVIVCGFLLPGVWATWLVFGSIVLPLSLWGGIAGPLLAAAARITLPFTISLFVIQGLFFPGGTPILPLGPVSLKAEGLQFAFLFASRLFLFSSAFMLLLLTTHPGLLMLALAQRGLPAHLAYIVVATLQIVPRFQARAASILDAQRARGLETTGSLARRLRAIIPLVGPLVLGSLVDVEERAIAIEARGFSLNRPKTSLIDIPDSGWEKWLRRGLILVPVVLLVARLTGWLR